MKGRSPVACAYCSKRRSKAEAVIGLAELYVCVASSDGKNIGVWIMWEEGLHWAHSASKPMYVAAHNDGHLTYGIAKGGVGVRERFLE